LVLRFIHTFLSGLFLTFLTIPHILSLNIFKSIQPITRSSRSKISNPNFHLHSLSRLMSPLPPRLFLRGTSVPLEMHLLYCLDLAFHLFVEFGDLLLDLLCEYALLPGLFHLQVHDFRVGLEFLDH